MKINLNNGETLSYVKRQGGEQVLLLIHGNMATSVQWDLLVEKMDPAFTIYAVDLRGYGNSTYYSPVNSIRDFSEAIKQFADQLNLDKFYLAGWSNVGCVAMQFAADYPEYVLNIILLSSMSTRGFPVLNTDGKRIFSRDQIIATPGINAMLDAQKSKNKEFFKAAMDQLLYSNNQPDEERYRRYLVSAVQQRNMIDAAYAANIFNISTVSNDAAESTGEIMNIKAPVLIIWGKNDLLTTEEMTLEIIEDMENAGVNFNYSPINAGHALLIDNLEAVLEEIYKFLDVPVDGAV